MNGVAETNKQSLASSRSCYYPQARGGSGLLELGESGHSNRSSAYKGSSYYWTLVLETVGRGYFLLAEPNWRLEGKAQWCFQGQPPRAWDRAEE